MHNLNKIDNVAILVLKLISKKLKEVSFVQYSTSLHFEITYNLLLLLNQLLALQNVQSHKILIVNGKLNLYWFGGCSAFGQGDQIANFMQIKSSTK